MAPTTQGCEPQVTQPADAPSTTLTITPDSQRYAATALGLMPSPIALEQLLGGDVADHLERLREQRGEVITSDQTWDAVRWLHGIDEVLEHYGKTIAAIRKMVAAELGDELRTAVGQDARGVPKNSMVVPDEGTTITLSPGWKTERVIDEGQVHTVAVSTLAEQRRAAGTPVPDEAVTFAVQAIAEVLGTMYGKTAKMLASGPARAKAEAAARGLDTLAKVAEDADQGTTYTFDKVKVERKSPTQPGAPKKRAASTKRA